VRGPEPVEDVDAATGGSHQRGRKRGRETRGSLLVVAVWRWGFELADELLMVKRDRCKCNRTGSRRKEWTGTLRLIPCSTPERHADVQWSDLREVALTGGRGSAGVYLLPIRPPPIKL